MSLLAVAKADSFEDAVTSIISLGGDTDTVGAICGGMAGAAWGLSGIPDFWKLGLCNSELIQSRAKVLGQLAAKCMDPPSQIHNLDTLLSMETHPVIGKYEEEIIE